MDVKSERQEAYDKLFEYVEYYNESGVARGLLDESALAVINMLWAFVEESDE